MSLPLLLAIPEPTLSSEPPPILIPAASEAEAKLNQGRREVLSAAARQRKAATAGDREGMKERSGGPERGRIEVGFIGNIP